MIITTEFALKNGAESIYIHIKQKNCLKWLVQSPCLSRSMRFENSGNSGTHAENTHVQIIFVATHSIQFQSHTYWPGYLNNLQR